MAAVDLYTAASELLDACSAQLATTIGGPISRAYVSPGDPAFDCCPQLTVHVSSLSQLETSPVSPVPQPGMRPRLGVVYQAEMVVTVVRCVSVPEGGQLISAAQLDLEAQAVLADGWAIWNMLHAHHGAGTLLGPACREVFLDRALAISPEGGCAGWEFRLRAQLDGYQP